MNVAVVSGGAGPGIGSAVSRLLAARGFAVWVLDRDKEACDAVVESIAGAGGVAYGAVVDVADADAVADVFAGVARTSSVVHAVVNDAGVGLNKLVADVTEEDYDGVMAVDLRGTWLVTRAAVPMLVAAGGGAIVNIGSVHALGAEVRHGVYAAAKAGMVALTRATARDYGPDGIRCTIVHPGAVNSPQTRELSIARGEDPDAFLHEVLHGRQMLRRPILADDVANAVAFLVSDEAAAITGCELLVDAGMSNMLWDNREDR